MVGQAGGAPVQHVCKGQENGSVDKDDPDALHELYELLPQGLLGAIGACEKKGRQQSSMTATHGHAD